VPSPSLREWDKKRFYDITVNPFKFLIILPFLRSLIFSNHAYELIDNIAYPPPLSKDGNSF
jgi:hypothetical protein